MNADTDNTNANNSSNNDNFVDADIMAQVRQQLHHRHTQLQQDGTLDELSESEKQEVEAIFNQMDNYKPSRVSDDGTPIVENLVEMVLAGLSGARDIAFDNEKMNEYLHSKGVDKNVEDICDCEPNGTTSQTLFEGSQPK